MSIPQPALDDKAIDAIIDDALFEIINKKIGFKRETIVERLRCLSLNDDEYGLLINRMRQKFIETLTNERFTPETRLHIYDSLIEMAKGWPLNNEGTCPISFEPVTKEALAKNKSTFSDADIKKMEDNLIFFYTGYCYYNDPTNNKISRYLMEKGCCVTRHPAPNKFDIFPPESPNSQTSTLRAIGKIDLLISAAFSALGLICVAAILTVGLVVGTGGMPFFMTVFFGGISGFAFLINSAMSGVSAIDCYRGANKLEETQNSSNIAGRNDEQDFIEGKTLKPHWGPEDLPSGPSVHPALFSHLTQGETPVVADVQDHIMQQDP
jgi:hypothetical protein